MDQIVKNFQRHLMAAKVHLMAVKAQVNDCEYFLLAPQSSFTIRWVPRVPRRAVLLYTPQYVFAIKLAFSIQIYQISMTYGKAGLAGVASLCSSSAFYCVSSSAWVARVPQRVKKPDSQRQQSLIWLLDNHIGCGHGGCLLHFQLMGW